MAKNRRWTILLALLATAGIFYTIGFSSGAVAAIMLGCLFEIAFWFRLFGSSDGKGHQRSS